MSKYAKKLHSRNSQKFQYMYDGIVLQLTGFVTMI